MPCSSCSRTGACIWDARSQAHGPGIRSARATAAQYDTVGQRIAGPPIRPLDRFQWEIKNSDELWITQRWSVDFNGDGKVLYFPVKMPGQPVAPPGPSIVADVLYPNVTYDHGAVPQAK